MHKYFAPPGGGRCPVTVDSTGQRAPHRARRSAMGLALATIAAGAAAQSHSTADARKAVELDPVEIRGHYDNSVGSSDAASGGVITPQLIEDRPLLRPGNLLEYVPGMVVTQHSGAGKANQYFLRGFNLDHGTDFSTWVAGMPVNLRTHGHGQGYSDLNFIIPELISGVDYWKGPYYANIGDFSSAGGASMRYFDSMKERVALATGGDYGYARGLLAGSAPAGSGVVTYGLELLHNDGPWEVPDHFRKYNAVLRYTRPLGEGKFSATAMAYGGNWNSTDQVAQRAIDSGIVARFGSLDTSDGGESQRYSFSADYAGLLAGGQFQTTAYWFKYKLNLFSNFTYFLDDPVNGDQFEQADDRNVYGWTGKWSKSGDLLGKPTINTLGYELRQDRIRPVGLYSTRRRERLSTTREDNVTEGSAGIYGQNDTQWNSGFRSLLGLRYDRYRFNVDSNVAENSGSAAAGIWSPKASLIFGPWDKTEYFVNYGSGFHSNDARGVTIKVDPKSGDPVNSATPLVRSTGAELGLRSEIVPNIQSSLALWYLKLGSELVFVGDAGTTEAGRRSQRYGIEWNTRWRPVPWLYLDLDLAWNHARFSENAPEGNFIPGAPSSVMSAGIAVDRHGAWSGALFMTYIGSYPLIEDNSIRSKSNTTFDGQIAYALTPKAKVRFDVFNILDTQNNDITYYYTSRLPGEPAQGMADTHFHPGEKRSFRISLAYSF